MATKPNKRQGLGDTGQLSQDLRRVLEPITDWLSRIGGAFGKLDRSNENIDLLPAGAVLADVIDKVNEVIEAQKRLQVKLNAIMDRLESD